MSRLKTWMFAGVAGLTIVGLAGFSVRQTSRLTAANQKIAELEATFYDAPGFGASDRKAWRLQHDQDVEDIWGTFRNRAIPAACRRDKDFAACAAAMAASPASFVGENRDACGGLLTADALPKVEVINLTESERDIVQTARLVTFYPGGSRREMMCLVAIDRPGTVILPK